MERITHLANIWAVEEHKCFVLCPNSKSVFLKQPLVPRTQKLPIGTRTLGSREPPAPLGDGPLRRCDVHSFMPFAGERQGDEARAKQNVFYTQGDLGRINWS